jgi:2'-hydroxyisoflavone reductase
VSSLLIIGGTVFLGPAVAEEALRRGHAVTVLNRGLSGCAPPGVETIRADRDDPARFGTAVAGRRWDTVVDTCGFVPRSVGANARQLSAHADHYILLSSVDAMPAWPAEPVDESAQIWRCPPDAGASAGSYGELKAGCERAVRAAFAGRTTVLRSGVIVGPRENIGRLPWWLSRMERGGPTLVPGAPQRVQLIDVRDLAAFVVQRHEEPGAGVYLTPGSECASLRDVVDWCGAATSSTANLVEADDETLLTHGVQPWWELPMWAPAGSRWRRACDVSGRRANEDGLTCRPLVQTVRETLTWLRGVTAYTGRPKIGLAAAKEQRVLDALMTTPSVPRSAR